MSKRLFILNSLLETHPRRAATKARVWTPVVIRAQIGSQRRGASGDRCRLQQRDAIEADPRQDARHRRSRDAERGTDLPGGRPGASQRDDGRFHARSQPTRLAVRARRGVGQRRLAGARDPFGDGPDADPQRGRNAGIGPALPGRGSQSAVACVASSSRYDELSFGRPSRNVGLVS